MFIKDILSLMYFCKPEIYLSSSNIGNTADGIGKPPLKNLFQSKACQIKKKPFVSADTCSSSLSNPKLRSHFSNP